MSFSTNTSELYLSTICNNCGKEYGEHCGDVCPRTSHVYPATGEIHAGEETEIFNKKDQEIMQKNQQIDNLLANERFLKKEIITLTERLSNTALELKGLKAENKRILSEEISLAEKAINIVKNPILKTRGTTPDERLEEILLKIQKNLKEVTS